MMNHFKTTFKYHLFRIHLNSKEYGFGQSLLHEGQLVFHTPPYSLQPVSLQECNESIGKANIRVARPVVEHRSPMAPHKSASAAAVVDPASSGLNKTVSGDKIDLQAYQQKIATSKDTSAATGCTGSPSTLERKNRRFSYANSR